MLARPEVQSQENSIAGAITLVFASGVGLCLGQPQLRGERLDWLRRGTKIKDALLAGTQRLKPQLRRIRAEMGSELRAPKLRWTEVFR